MSRFAEECLPPGLEHGFINYPDERAGAMNTMQADTQYNRKKGSMLLTLAAGLVLAVGAAATQARSEPSFTATAGVVPAASSLPSTRPAEQAAVAYIVASEAQREALATLAHAELSAQPVILVAADEVEAARYLAEVRAGVRVYDLR